MIGGEQLNEIVLLNLWFLYNIATFALNCFERMSCVYVAHFMSILIQSLIYEVLTCYIINNVLLPEKIKIVHVRLQLNWSFSKKGQFCIRYKDD